jgi:Sec-independent protein translocase protein TatA
LENSYVWMNDKLSVKTGRLGAFNRVINGGESVENIVSELSSATSEFREVGESVENIQKEWNKINEKTEEEVKDKKEKEDIIKNASQGTQPDNQQDFTPDSTD